MVQYGWTAVSTDIRLLGVADSMQPHTLLLSLVKSWGWMCLEEICACVLILEYSNLIAPTLGLDTVERKERKVKV